MQREYWKRDIVTVIERRDDREVKACFVVSMINVNLCLGQDSNLKHDRQKWKDAWDDTGLDFVMLELRARFGWEDFSSG